MRNVTRCTSAPVRVAELTSVRSHESFNTKIIMYLLLQKYSIAQKSSFDISVKTLLNSLCLC